MEGMSCFDKERQLFMHKNKGLGLLQEAALEGRSLGKGFIADASYALEEGTDSFRKNSSVFCPDFQLLLGLNWKTHGF